MPLANDTALAPPGISLFNSMFDRSKVFSVLYIPLLDPMNIP